MKNLQMLGMLGLGNATVLGLPTSFDLSAEIRSAKEVKLATAFGHMSGWKSIRPAIQGSTAKIQILAGLSFCQTEPRVLADWLNMCARDERINARLFVKSDIVFHPKVLLIKSAKRNCVVIGSGNLSGGGLLNNIECGLFSTNPSIVQQANKWFMRLFDDNALTSTLRRKDIDRYTTKYKEAARKNRETERLEREIEDQIATRHQASIARWEEAVAKASRFFKSQSFKNYYAKDRATVAAKIKRALNYPTFDFDRDGLERFYKIQSLGHLIEIYKNRVWDQRRRLQAGLRFLINDSIPIKERLTEVFEGRYRVERVGNNFLTKVLAVHDPMNFTVDNAPVLRALKYFEYDMPRGYTTAEQYMEFVRLMKRFRIESAAKNSLYVDAFFYNFWEQHIKK